QPMVHLPDDDRTDLVRFPIEPLAPRIQVRPKPVQGLSAQPGALLGVEPVGVLALAATGSGRRAGGVISMHRARILRQLRLAGECGFVEPDSGRVTLAVWRLAKLSQVN